VEDIEFDLPREFTDIIGLSNIMGTDGRRWDRMLGDVGL
jgi:hypothetical protein